MGDYENGTDEWAKADEAAPDPSSERPVRHTFILRLIPTFREPPEARPDWHGEMEHVARGNELDRRRFGSVDAMLKALKRRTSRIVE